VHPNNRLYYQVIIWVSQTDHEFMELADLYLLNLNRLKIRARFLKDSGSAKGLYADYKTTYKHNRIKDQRTGNSAHGMYTKDSERSGSGEEARDRVDQEMSHSINSSFNSLMTTGLTHKPYQGPSEDQIDHNDEPSSSLDGCQANACVLS